MNSLVFSLLAAGCTSLSSLFFRKNADNSHRQVDSPSGYLVLFYFFSLILSSFFIRYLASRSEFDYISDRRLCRALEFNDDAIDISSIETWASRSHFCFSKCKCYFSWVDSFFIIGFRFWLFMLLPSASWNGAGPFGLFLGAKKESASSSKPLQMVKIRLSLFHYSNPCSIHSFRLVVFYSIAERREDYFQILLLTEADDVWFMPGQFGASFMMQAVIFYEKIKDSRRVRLFMVVWAGLQFFVNRPASFSYKICSSP